MGLPDHLETQLERQIPAQLQAALQQALDDYQPTCAHCRLAMHRHHRYSRAIAASYGEVRRQIPVFRCGQCRRMAGTMTLPGDEMRHQRFSKKNRDIGISLAVRRGIGRRRVWSSAIGSCGGGSSWGRYGWTEHNLLALLPEQGLINQTT